MRYQTSREFEFDARNPAFREIWAFRGEGRWGRVSEESLRWVVMPFFRGATIKQLAEWLGRKPGEVRQDLLDAWLLTAYEVPEPLPVRGKPKPARKRKHTVVKVMTGEGVAYGADKRFCRHGVYSAPGEGFARIGWWLEGHEILPKEPQS